MCKRQLFFVCVLLLGSASALAQMAYDAPSAGNPIIAGYFADPTVKKFGDTYYIYTTTDGNGAGFGPAQVWSSKDFVNWTLMPMNWPDSHWIWAPDVLHHSDGKYYYFYCQPCKIYCGVSDTPRGPWENILGESEAVLVPDRYVENVITLDGQTFVDNDGSVYLYWGTWGIYDGFGCGAGKMTDDLKGFTETRLIPNTEAIDFFEAPFVFKRNGVYYMLYSCESCHDSSYHVQYATADAPLGPYTFKGCIMETNDDDTVDGPGHTSVLQEGDDYYLVYHRHNNPHSTRGFHRQICADRMTFDSEGNINRIIPSHDGVGFLAPSMVKSKNLALEAKVKASSFYSDNFRPEYAVDDNNGTLWRPCGVGQEWIEIDLGRVEEVRSIWTQFEYATQFYQYLIETSKDEQKWEVFADKRANCLAGSPMVDFGDTKARYVRLTYTNGQKNGFPGAIWNVKVFRDIEDSSPQQWLGLTAYDWDGLSWQNNEGMLGGAFVREKGSARVIRIQGREALELAPHTILKYSNILLSPGKEHTLSAMCYENRQWQALEEGAVSLSLKDGEILLQSGNEPLIVTNLRYYNWKLDDAERAYDAQTDIQKVQATTLLQKGLVVDISADDFAIGDTVHFLANHGIEGLFVADRVPDVVVEEKGKKAIPFDGKIRYKSMFGLPVTLQDNAPYTLEAWLLNDEIGEDECVADFTSSSFGELEKIMLKNGTDPRGGIIDHNGWFEDAGREEMKELEGKWQHIYVCFDGFIEQVYVNEQLVSKKDIQLLIRPSQNIIIGGPAMFGEPFTGYLNSLKLWDEYIPFDSNKHQ